VIPTTVTSLISLLHTHFLDSKNAYNNLKIAYNVHYVEACMAVLLVT